MALKHSVYDTDTHFSINPITKVLKNGSSSKNTLVQYDHNSERITFEIPRYIEGHDMSLCNVVEVHFDNINAKTMEQNSDVYKVEDLQISPDDDSVVILSWLVSDNATQHAGSLNFVIRFSCTEDDGTVLYAFNTIPYSGISISAGIYNSKAVIERHPDIFAQLEADIYTDEATLDAILDEVMPIDEGVEQ